MQLSKTDGLSLTRGIATSESVRIRKTNSTLVSNITPLPLIRQQVVMITYQKHKAKLRRILLATTQCWNSSIKLTVTVDPHMFNIILKVKQIPKTLKIFVINKHSAFKKNASLNFPISQFGLDFSNSVQCGR